MTRGIAVGAVVATISLVIALSVGTPDPGIAERAFAGVIGLLALSAVTARLGLWSHEPTDGTLHASGDGLADEESSVGAWYRLERALRLGALTAGDFDVLVRPRLSELALARHGDAPSAAEASRIDRLLGPDGLLSDRSSRLADRRGPGVGLDELDEIITVLEDR